MEVLKQMQVDLNKFAIDMKNYYGAEIKAESINEKKHDEERNCLTQDPDIKDRPHTTHYQNLVKRFLKIN